MGNWTEKRKRYLIDTLKCY